MKLVLYLEIQLHATLYEVLGYHTPQVALLVCQKDLNQRLGCSPHNCLNMHML